MSHRTVQQHPFHHTPDKKAESSVPVPDSLPQWHLRPEYGWINDPNGMVFRDGRWHVFYQHNPQAPVHDRIAWGHSSSEDLVHWTHHPVAFHPTPDGPDAFGCWSGVYLPWVDEPAMVYSAIADDSLRSTVAVRTSDDPTQLDTWSVPHVIAGTPADVTEMRDPFCFTWAGRRLALMGARVGQDSPAVLLFAADDPWNWTYEGVWLTEADPVAAQMPRADIWECPQLVQVDGRWTLILSLQHEGRLGRVRYLLGDLRTDKHGLPRFTAKTGGEVDDGPDFYAPQVALDPDGPWLLGWIRPEVDARGQEVPTVNGVAGCLTLPRRLAAQDGVLTSRPDDRLTRWAAAGTQAAIEAQVLRAGLRVDTPSRLELEATDLRLTGASGEHRIDALPQGTTVWLDGEVVEVHPPGGTPWTARSTGTTTWTVHADCAGRLSELGRPTRG